MEVFLPVQMCHVAVREGNRTWHGACHVDDALQAPEGRMHIDGYQQGKHETAFADYEHIPGLNWGGWHDAGDHDLPAGSIAKTTLALALAQEEFHPGLDRTTFRRAEREVLLHVPDGEEDLLQQVEWGVEGLLASFRVAGHIFAGIIESTRDQYDHTGDPVNITDSLVYDSSLKPDQVSGDRSGKPDDRWAFTNRNTGLQYRVAQTLAAASRVLRGKKPALSEECLAAAGKLWEYEQTNAPVYAPRLICGSRRELSGGRDRSHGGAMAHHGRCALPEASLCSAAPNPAASPEQFGGGPGWMLVRLMSKVSDPEYRKVVVEQAKKWKAATDAMEAANPYGVRFPSSALETRLETGLVRAGEREHRKGLRMGLADRMPCTIISIQKHLPEIFDANSLFAAVNFVLGCHPATNTSLCVRRGDELDIDRLWINRDEWTYIPGGVISGVSLVSRSLWNSRTSRITGFRRNTSSTERPVTSL